MKQNIRKYIVYSMAGLAAACFLMDSSQSQEVMAAGGSGQVGIAVGEEENYVPEEENAEPVSENREDIFRTVLPADTEHVFDFIMDPQGLIRQTDAAAYGNLVFEEGATLFFKRSDGECKEDYSSCSDALVITNQGTADIDIELTASVRADSLEGIALTDDRDFTDDAGASLYLALTDGEHTVPIGSEEGASLHVMLERDPEKDGVYSEYRFWLTGAVNEKGDWSEVRDVSPKVTVTWSVTQEETADAETEGLPDDQDAGMAGTPEIEGSREEPGIPENDPAADQSSEEERNEPGKSQENGTQGADQIPAGALNGENQGQEKDLNSKGESREEGKETADRSSEESLNSKGEDQEEEVQDTDQISEGGTSGDNDTRGEEDQRVDPASEEGLSGDREDQEKGTQDTVRTSEGELNGENEGQDNREQETRNLEETFGAGETDGQSVSQMKEENTEGKQ